ncbi:hypothetical protein CTKA_01739 [Chthonomonas calidirosea]|uniref:Uncharacterized protein n=1 Tax=Chthonomonas calidirosea (strain DSM 23976 / ICMP 18418 / T49) TaxID=1303518 RepID=S0EWK2_CHTCT|nr:hypothetical protein CCALI_02357 [Chthonomonas calidirosea T49]CEK18158.1 hypothetical protein CTKA_01739 [Chthonomonas calidirosea]
MQGLSRGVERGTKTPSSECSPHSTCLFSLSVTLLSLSTIRVHLTLPHWSVLEWVVVAIATAIALCYLTDVPMGVIRYLNEEERKEGRDIVLIAFRMFFKATLYVSNFLRGVLAGIVFYGAIVGTLPVSVSSWCIVALLGDLFDLPHEQLKGLVAGLYGWLRRHLASWVGPVGSRGVSGKEQ